MCRKKYYNIKNICEGLSKSARNFLDFNIDTSKKTIIQKRFGSKNEFTLRKYFLMNGTTAEEYIQMIFTNAQDQEIYFLGLNVENQALKWTGKEMLELVETNSLN